MTRREPLLWFLVAGALILAADRLLWPETGTEPAPLTSAAPPAAITPIRIDAEVLADVRHRLSDGLGRAPTPAELDAAVERWIADELLVREARRLGLGRRDPVVRSRLAQRMADLYRDRAVPDRPDDDALRRLYDAQRADYRLAPRLTLRQAFIAAPEATGEALEASRRQAEALLARANAGEARDVLVEIANTVATADLADAGVAPPRRASSTPSSSRLGLDDLGSPPPNRHFRRGHPASPDPPPGGPLLRGRRPARLAELYGEAFVEGLLDAPLDTWLLRRSPQGWHLIRIEGRTPGRQLDFAEARDRLAARWIREQAAVAAERAVADLRGRTPVEGWPRDE